MIPKMGKFTTSEKALSTDECAAFGIRVCACVWNMFEKYREIFYGNEASI